MGGQIMAMFMCLFGLCLNIPHMVHNTASLYNHYNVDSVELHTVTGLGYYMCRSRPYIIAYMIGYLNQLSCLPVGPTCMVQPQDNSFLPPPPLPPPSQYIHCKSLYRPTLYKLRPPFFTKQFHIYHLGHISRHTCR